MLFNTPIPLFFSIVLGCYFLLPFRAQNVWLLGASYFFYGSWDWRFLSLLLLSTVIDFTAGLLIQAARGTGRRRGMKRALVVSVGGQLLILGIFKYFNFFAGSVASLLEAIGFRASLPMLQVLLPIGISFYTFQTMSYTIDIYRGAFRPTRSFVDFALSVAFFPHLVAGPIQRARSLIVADRAAAGGDPGALGAWPDAPAHRAHPEGGDCRSGRRPRRTPISPTRRASRPFRSRAV